MGGRVGWCKVFDHSAMCSRQKNSFSSIQSFGGPGAVSTYHVRTIEISCYQLIFFGILRRVATQDSLCDSMLDS